MNFKIKIHNIKILLVLGLFVVFWASSYAPFTIKENENAKYKLRDAIKNSNMKTSQDLREFRNGVVGLDILGGKYAKTCKVLESYTNFENDGSLSITDAYYINDLPESWESNHISNTQNKIYKTFTSSEPQSEKELLEMINYYYHIFNIFKKDHTASDRTRDFIQTLGTAYLSFLYPRLTTNLELKYKGKSIITKEIGYMLEMAQFFMDVAKEANKGQIENLVKEGIPRLLSRTFVSNDQRSFVSTDPEITDLELNNCILKGILSFGVESFVKSHNKQVKEFYNWFLSKKKVLKDTFSIYNLQFLKILKTHVPSLIINSNKFPKELSVKIVDFLGNEFGSKNITVTGTAKKVKSSKDITLVFEKKADGSFAIKGVEVQGGGVYRINVIVEVNGAFTYAETGTAHVKSTFEFGDQKVTKNSVVFALQVDGSEQKLQADHVFVEYRHTKNRFAKFVDSEKSFVNGKYYFKRILIDKPIYPIGDYDIYAGVYDEALKEAKTLKIGTVSNKNGIKNYKGEFVSKEEFNSGSIIENKFDPEIDYAAQYTIPMFIFVILSLLIGIRYAQHAFLKTTGLKGSAYVMLLLFSPLFVFYYLYWTCINIMQAAAISVIGLPYLAVILWMGISQATFK